MNATSASPADAPATPAATRGPCILVWDVPVRVFHWLMVLSFAGAWITAESERWRLLHVTLGYTMAGLVAFRLVWGLIGTKHARFADFVRGPRAVARYLGALLRGRPEHHVGHNPAGALAIVAMLALAAVLTFSGWATYNEVFGEALEDLHEGAANAMMAVVLVHVAGVAIASWMHRENLVGAMFTGYKHGDPREGIRRAWTSVGALMLAAVLGFWALQWQSAPAIGADRPALTGDAGHGDKAGHHDEDDDD